MNTGKLVFAQLMTHLPLTTFRRCVARYGGEHKVKQFTCLDQFLCMAFAQLTYRESLRDIEACLRSQSAKLYHMGFRSTVARKLYIKEPFGLDLSDTVYALDATTIDLCLSVFPWAPFRTAKAAVKLHTLLDLRGNIPNFIHISDGKWHEVNVLDMLIPEPGAFYIMDRGYLDFGRLHALHQAGSFFVIRAKSNLKFQRRYSHPTDRAVGVICDQIGTLTGFYSTQHYPDTLRRIRIKDAEGKTLVFLTNNTSLPAQTIAELYRCRWQIELFFKWVKQHLRIKSFFGTSENAVKSQIWIAVSVYVLVAIIKKRLNLSASLYEMLQILSLTMFERTPLDQLLARTALSQNAPNPANQLILFD